MKKLLAIGLAVLVLCMAGSAAMALGPSPTPSPAAGQKNIFQTAYDNGFKQSTAALTYTGLDKKLNGTGPYTVLMPTDDAFNKLPAGAKGSLMSNKPEMASVMDRYIINGKYTTDQMLKMGFVTTASGKKLSVTRGPGNSVMVGGATIVKPNIQASNGMIQGIDNVMLQPF